MVVDTATQLAAKKAEWLEARKSVISATQASVIWVAHNGGKLYKGSTPRDVWLEKKGEAPAFEGNLHTWVGSGFERAVCEWVAEDIGATLEYPEPYTLVYASEERRQLYPWLACTPDAYAVFPDGTRHLIEAKTGAGDAADLNAKWGPSGGFQVPFNYFSQVLYQEAVVELPVCHLGVALWMGKHHYGGRVKVEKDRRRYPIMRMPFVENEMLKVIAEWVHRHIDGDRCPPVYKGGK